MSILQSESSTGKTAAFGGFADAAGGIATIVLAVVGLANTVPEMVTAIATIVFGAALLIEGGAMASEYAMMSIPEEEGDFSEGQFGGNGLPALFLAGAAGIVLGILALLGMHAIVLTGSAIIAYGTALVLSSNSVWHLHHMKQRSVSIVGRQSKTGGEILANEMASGSAGMQSLAGLAAIVLGVLSLAGAANPATLVLVALLALGGALVLSGSTLSTAVLNFMGPAGANGRSAKHSFSKPGE